MLPREQGESEPNDDLAERAHQAGFELAVARDLFVHHFGSRTFNGAGIDAEKLLSETGNRQGAASAADALERYATDFRKSESATNEDRFTRMGVWREDHSR
jgi:hypothetical protein